VKAALTILVTSEQSHGRHGWTGKAVKADPARATGGAQALFNGSGGTGGGGQYFAKVVAWVPAGGSLPLDDGSALTFDGKEVVKVAGAGLRPEDDPTK
jgi:hypothetical protein